MSVLQIVLISFWSVMLVTVVILALVIDVVTFSSASIAALPALIISIFRDDAPLVAAQFVIFLVLFSSFWAGSYLWIWKRTKKRFQPQALNDSLNDHGVALKDIPVRAIGINNYGVVKIQGKKFRALSTDKDGLITKDHEVEVVRIMGNILVVIKAN